MRVWAVHIGQVWIQNFRSCRDVAVSLRPDVTVLVGENNSGKTTIIDAVRLLIDPLDGRKSRWPEKGDLTLGADEGAVAKLGARLDDIGVGQAGTYIEGLKPTYDLAAPRVATWAVAFTPPSDRQRRVKVDWMVGDARPTSGEPSVRILIRHVYLPPLRDALRGLGSNSGERIRLMLANLLGGTDEIAKFEARAAQSLAGLNDDDVIKTLTTTVTEPLLAITSGAQPQRAEARLSDPDLASLERAIHFHLDDSLSGTADIRASGLGYANILFIATVLAELQTAHENDLTVLLVEEPEAHLHPQLQTLLLRHLRKIASKSRATAEANGQDTEDSGETPGNI